MTHQYLNTNEPCDQFHTLLGKIRSKTGNCKILEIYEDLKDAETRRVYATMTHPELQILGPVQRDALLDTWYDIINTNLKSVLAGL